MPPSEQKLTRIGVFYDGNFFYHVSNYYTYDHPRKSRISIAGLHDFIRKKASELEGTEEIFCQIVDSHYFRGRIRSQDAQERNLLLKERAFDDILMREGITTHYLPLGPDGEKGIDVWLALEAYEMAIYKQYDVTVLIAGDGDFLPLIRKLNTIGTRVMLLAWDFLTTDRNGEKRLTKTAQVLLDEVTYPIPMHAIIDDKTRQNDPIVRELFLQQKDAPPLTAANEPDVSTASSAVESRGTIQNIKEGYGFITPAEGGNNLFFHHTAIAGSDFNELEIGEEVFYTTGMNEKGPYAVGVQRARERGSDRPHEED